MIDIEKEQILASLNSFPAELIAKYIVDKDFTLEEAIYKGNLSEEKIHAIEPLIASMAAAKKSEEMLVVEPDDALELLQEIKEKHCTYDRDQLLKHLADGVITPEVLVEVGIPEAIVNNLSTRSHDIEIGDNPEKLTDGCTEIYFWGIPSSGKTCAIGAILSALQSHGLAQYLPGSGYHYMTQLGNLFKPGEVTCLPPGTTEQSTQCLSLHLKDDNGQEHPISLIDLAGGVFKCFYFFLKHNEDPKLLGQALNSGEVSQAGYKTFNLINKFLTDKRNRKYHYFVVDVTTQDGEMLVRQADYLNAAATYLTKNGLLTTADGICIIATKSDNLGTTPEEYKEQAREFLQKNYAQFINPLREVIKRNGIDDRGRVPFIAFSLGDVYFNDLCLFDPASAELAVKHLQWNTGIYRAESAIRQQLSK